MSAKPKDRIDDSGVVEVSVLIAARPETVWTFLSDPERFASWIGAYAGQGALPGTQVDPRIGGQIRVEYPGGNASAGKVTALDEQRRIAFTWGYESGHDGVPPGATQVEITLSPSGDGTLVCLRHAGLTTADSRRGHFGGWKHYLSTLARGAADAQHAAPFAAALDAYYEAWREPDDAARLRLLDVCCDPDVRIRTAWACTDGIDELSAHIANGQKHMPGMTLHAVGSPQLTHGYGRSLWAVRTLDGATVMQGENIAELQLTGRLRSVISFANAPG